MSKLNYEEALELLDNGCDGPDAIDIYKKALEQAQKQEKLLKLYKELMTVKDDMINKLLFVDSDYYAMEKIEINLERQIDELLK